MTTTFPNPLQFIHPSTLHFLSSSSAPPLTTAPPGPLQSPLPRLSLPLPTLQSPPRRPLRALQLPTRSISTHFCDRPLVWVECPCLFVSVMTYIDASSLLAVTCSAVKNQVRSMSFIFFSPVVHLRPGPPGLTSPTADTLRSPRAADVGFFNSTQSNLEIT